MVMKMAVTVMEYLRRKAGERGEGGGEGQLGGQVPQRQVKPKAGIGQSESAS